MVTNEDHRRLAGYVQIKLHSLPNPYYALREILDSLTEFNGLLPCYRVM